MFRFPKPALNCQSLVSLSLATEAVSMPVACDLYLPED